MRDFKRESAKLNLCLEIVMRKDIKACMNG